MSAIRDKARELLAKVPETGEVHSKLNAALFGELTNGVTDEELKKNWRAWGIRTVCIDFVCWYAGKMGINILADIPKEKRDGKVDGFFNLEATLAKDGKSYAYVASTEGGPVPQFGDILRHRPPAFHVDVALDFKGNILHRAAGGQSYHPRPENLRPKKDPDNPNAPLPPPPGVEQEHDNVMRVKGKGPYNPQDLQGWLDLDLYFGGAPTFDPSLAWLYGWWEVWDGNTYYYSFGQGGVVKYILTPPDPTDRPPQRPRNIGRYTYTPGKLVITWSQVIGAEAACEETFYNAASGCQRMNATSTLYGPLVAKRM